MVNIFTSKRTRCDLKSGGHVTITHQMLASTFRTFTTKVCFDHKKCEEVCVRLFRLIPIFHDIQFFYLAYFRNKLLLCRLTSWWGEMNLISQFFLVVSPGKYEHDLWQLQRLVLALEKIRASGTYW